MAWERDPPISADAFTLSRPLGASKIAAADISNEELLAGEAGTSLSRVAQHQRNQDVVGDFPAGNPGGQLLSFLP